MTLVEALINSENAFDEKEALALISTMQDRIYGEEETDFEEILAEYGLEPDYIFDLIQHRG